MATSCKNVLVTGGAGYIGSHCVVELANAGFTPVIVDNFVNASEECLKRVEKIVGKTICSYNVDMLDTQQLDDVFQKHKFSAVIHLAALKAVGESCEQPLRYYKNNIICAINLLELMGKHKVYNLVFSSSATVYGTPQYLPLDEQHSVGQGITNPYGQTKYFIECILTDLCKADKQWNVVMLRYFNPVGAHISGQIGEDPSGLPNNLMPFVAQVAVGKLAEVKIFGSDYNTIDGTGVRDYIHIVDLAKGHVSALSKLEMACGLKVYNLGTGRGNSVLEMIAALESSSGKKVMISGVGNLRIHAGLHIQPLDLHDLRFYFLQL